MNTLTHIAAVAAICNIAIPICFTCIPLRLNLMQEGNYLPRISDCTVLAQPRMFHGIDVIKRFLNITKQKWEPNIQHKSKADNL